MIEENTKNLFPLGDLWYSEYYRRIILSLGLSEKEDDKSSELLSTILARKGAELEYIEVRNKIRGNLTLLAGAGPSIESDLTGLEDFIRSRKPFVAASDGAADALAIADVDPDVIVTDLDSCSELKLLKESNRGTPLVVHAHGDNAELIKGIVPKLGTNILGTTQSVAKKRVFNVGGFTDGDRACYFISNFKPRAIVIAGMDFGPKEGEHSKSRVLVAQSSVPDFKKRKLAWGKESLEYLIRQIPEIKFVNVTRWGEEIEGAERLSYSEISRRF